MWGKQSSDFHRGKECEQKFIDACTKAGKSATPSTKSTDINHHIDVWVDGVGVDVKSERTDGFIWAELKNVQGKPGWMFGRADYFAFEDLGRGCFVIVRADLFRMLVLRNVTYGVFVQSSKDALYQLYQREGRKDVITKIHKADLYKIKNYLLFW